MKTDIKLIHESLEWTQEIADQGIIILAKNATANHFRSTGRVMTEKECFRSSNIFLSFLTKFNNIKEEYDQTS